MAHTPEELEGKLLSNVELFSAKISWLAWGWRNIDPWQRQVLLTKDRYMILNCSRQSGKSSILMLKAFQKALTTPNALILIIAEQRQSNEDLRKIDELVKAYDSYLRRRYEGRLVLSLLKDNVTSKEFENNARIVALPGNEKIRGYSAPTIVIIDEAGYVDDNVFIAVDPMMEVSQGQLILASTPNGTSGFYPQEWGNPRYTARFQVPWQQCPRISKESIESKRLMYGESYVRQEYETRFLDDVAALFTEKSLYESMDPDQEVFSEEMQGIQRAVTGDAELI